MHPKPYAIWSFEVKAAQATVILIVSVHLGWDAAVT